MLMMPHLMFFFSSDVSQCNTNDPLTFTFFFIWYSSISQWFILFSCLGQLNRWPCQWLSQCQAIWVSESLSQWVSASSVRKLFLLSFFTCLPPNQKIKTEMEVALPINYLHCFHCLHSGICGVSDIPKTAMTIRAHKSIRHLNEMVAGM